MSKRKRRRFTPEEKLKILKSHLVEKIPISEVCEENGISPTLFYNWQKQLFDQGTQAFETKRQRPSQLKRRDAKIKDLEAKLAHKNEVLSEAVEALVTAKKLSGDR